jgi:hypothetical protein
VAAAGTSATGTLVATDESGGVARLYGDIRHPRHREDRPCRHERAHSSGHRAGST